jgi:hypothetical protein
LRLLTVSKKEAFGLIHRNDDATALLGMSGFVVGVQELIDGEW